MAEQAVGMEERLERMDALLTRLEGIATALGTAVTTLSQPSGASDRILPWQPVVGDDLRFPNTSYSMAGYYGPQTPEEKKAEQEAIEKIIEKALAERQEPLPLAD